MLLNCNDIDKSFLDNHVLKHVSFHLNEFDKAALIGVNGCGKTTLIRMIMGELSPDSGSITFSKDKTIGYLAQNAILDSDKTISEELLSAKQDLILMEQRLKQMEHDMKTCSGTALTSLLEEYTTLTHSFELQGGYLYKSQLTGVLRGLGFMESDFNKSVRTLSGGEKTRVALGKLLFLNPNLIILDEPTNHLDMNATIWLETYLLNYQGTVLIVSHDRYFLDRIVNHVLELENGILTSFLGNYTDYAAKKEILRCAAYHAYCNQQREISHQEAVIEKLRSFNREKSIKRADSRAKMLDKIERIDKPVELNTKMKLSLTPRFESGNDVLSVSELSKTYGQKCLFKELTFFIKKGEHTAIIGDNGTGKTTLLKILNQIESADTGVVTLGSNVSIGYYDQEHHVLHDEKTIFDEISDDYPDLTNTEIRNMLAAFLFTGDDVYKQIASLSGGEKGRVSLAKLMLSRANFLILDEPTNHLDITSKEILEDALNAYNGTILYVSHDRYFINRTARRILSLKNQCLTNYLGNYDDYLEKKDTLISSDVSENSCPENAIEKSSIAKTDWKVQKEEQASKRRQKNELKKIEEEIAALEQKVKDIEQAMLDSKNCKDAILLMDLQKKKEELDHNLDRLYEKWEEIS